MNTTKEFRSPLPRDFFARDTLTVARALLGKMLVREIDGDVLYGRILETEAYVGEDDKACHASKGRTARTEVMFGEPGRAYVYLIYGMHNMLNVVTEREGLPAAVLIRSVGEWDGPGKLTRGLRIDRSLNGHDVTTSGELYVVDDGVAVDDAAVERTGRIGVDYAGEDARLPWRFIVR